MPKNIVVNDNSFTNLFPEITYDRDETTLPILDIWNNIRVVTFPDADDTVYTYYRLQEGDSLYDISKQFYDTIKFWWLIPLVNDAEDPFTFLDDVLNGNHPLDLPAKNIRVLKRNFLPAIIRNITIIKNTQQVINERNALEGNDQ